MTDDLISPTTRGLFRSLMTGSTVGEIATAFQDEGFAPDPDCSYQGSSVRRETTQAYSNRSTGAIRGMWPGRCGHSSG
jgi:hypothetical protein